MALSKTRYKYGPDEQGPTDELDIMGRVKKPKEEIEEEEE